MATQANQLLVDLARIVPSKTNPRKHFGDEDLQELAASIKSLGVIEPIICRPLNGNGKLELVVGERRWKAAKIAGLKEIPTIVRQLDDFQAREVQIVENLQRKDVHPLEEGLGYKALLDLRLGTGKEAKPIYTIDQVAAKVGKSTSYVYQRLKLASLTEDWQKEFFDHGDRFTAGHAILIARLRPEHQALVLKNWWKADYDKEYPSVRDLGERIDRDVHRKLDGGAFKKDDATYGTAAAADIHPDFTPAPDPLYAGDAKRAKSSQEAGFGLLPACTGCRFSSANSPLDFDNPDPKHPVCGNSPCYEKKVALQLVRSQKDLRQKHPNAVVVSREWGGKVPAGAIPAAKYNEVKPSAKGAVPALVVDGRDKGHTIYIAPSKSEEGAAARRQPSAKERLESLEHDIQRDLKRALLVEVSKAFKLDDFAIRRLAAFCLAEGFPNSGDRERVCGEAFKGTYSEEQVAKVITKWGKPQLIAAIATGLYGTDAVANYRDSKSLVEAAHRYKVDVRAIEKKVRTAPNYVSRAASIKTQQANEKKPKAKAPTTPKAKGKKQAKAEIRVRDGKLAAANADDRKRGKKGRAA